MSSSGDDTKGGWIYLVGPLGILVGVMGKFTHNHTILGVAIVMLFSAGITGVIQMFRETRTPAPKTPRCDAAQLPLVPVRTAAAMRTTPAHVESRREPVSAPRDSEPGITFDETGLSGRWIRHAGGPYFVTEDLDAPMPRRAVAVLDAYGQRGILHVAVDGMGRVVEAAVPGSPWGPARAR